MLVGCTPNTGAVIPGSATNNPMSYEEIDTRALYDQTCIAAQELTDPEYIKELTTMASWKASAVALALLFQNLDEALIKGGEFPIEWALGGPLEDVPE